MPVYAAMPKPDELVQDTSGRVCAAMFYYAADDTDLTDIAASCEAWLPVR